MKGKHHGPLECCTNIFKTKQHFPVGESSLRTYEGRFVLVFQTNFNLVVAEKNNHKREDLTPHTLFQDLINQWYQEIIFRTHFIQVPKIHANMDRTLLLVNRNRVGDPFHKRNWVDKSCIEKLLNFHLHFRFLPWVHRSQLLSNRLYIFIVLNLMLNYSRIIARHFLIRPCEHISKLLKECCILSDLILWAFRSDKDIFNNFRVPINVDWDHFRYVSHVSFGIDTLSSQRINYFINTSNHGWLELSTLFSIDFLKEIWYMM